MSCELGASFPPSLGRRFHCSALLSVVQASWGPCFTSSPMLQALTTSILCNPESLRLPLGRTSLPLALSDILRLALEKPPFTTTNSSPSTPTPSTTITSSPALSPSLRSESPCPTGDQADAIVEICRVAGNMCFDCGESE